MIKYFPEIEQFFINHSFTHDELEKFINSIDEKYFKQDLNKKAHSLIRLKLLKYQIQQLNNDEKLKQNNHHKKNEKPPKPIKKEKKDPYENQNKWVNESLIKLKKMSIKQISELLEIRSELLIRIIGRKGQIVQMSDIVSDEIFKIFEDYAKNRLILNYRHKKLNQLENTRIIKSNKKLNNNQNTVYDKLELRGFGKLIYIRSK